MNTKTMRLPPRRVVTSTNKRKEREGFDSLKPLTPQQAHPRHPPPPPPPPLPRLSKPSSAQAAGWDKPTRPSSAQPNQLLAGYLAHEFLTRGTLFGQPWDPARPETTPSPSGFTEPKRAKPSQKAENDDDDDTNTNHRRYAEVARLLKADGAHLPGIVNPTQLARFLQM